MNYVIPILLLINVACFAQDSIPIYSHQYLIEKEITCCKSAKNQLKCVDSLIQANLKDPDYSGKGDNSKVYFNRYRKLLIYNFNAGIISGLRGDLERSFTYFDLSEHYLDTLKQNGKVDEFEDYQKLIRYQKTEFCYKMYLEDTILFNQCNCAQFFPTIGQNEITLDTIIPTTKDDFLAKKRHPLWGEFYQHDTLRINNHFVSDSASIVYFKKIMRPLILSKLQQNPIYFEMLGNPAMNLKRDTIIYKFSAKYVKESYERKCEVVFTSSQNPEKFNYILILIANIELPAFINDLEIYIPIVVTTENSIDTNKANIYDDHFLIEVIKN